MVDHAPHNFEPKFKYDQVFKIFITPQAMADMSLIVDICTEEVGWMGYVERRGNDFIVYDVFVPKQKASSVLCELDFTALAEVGEALIQTPDGIAKYNQMRFWGHSHHTMGTSPSGQDDIQLREFDACEWFIRGILNKHGRMELTLYFFKLGLEIRDVPWQIYYEPNPSKVEYWESEIEKNVEVTKYVAETRWNGTEWHKEWNQNWRTNYKKDKIDQRDIGFRAPNKTARNIHEYFKEKVREDNKDVLSDIEKNTEEALRAAADIAMGRKAKSSSISCKVEVMDASVGKILHKTDCSVPDDGWDIEMLVDTFYSHLSQAMYNDGLSFIRKIQGIGWEPVKGGYKIEDKDVLVIIIEDLLMNAKLIEDIKTEAAL